MLSHVEQKLLTLPEHLSSSPVVSVVPIVQSLVFCVLCCRSVCHVVLFLFGIALSALRVTSSEYPVGIANLFSGSNLTLTTLRVSQKIPPLTKKKRKKRKKDARVIVMNFFYCDISFSRGFADLIFL